MKGYLYYMRPRHMRESVRTYRVMEGATLASLNHFKPGSAEETEGKLFFKGTAGEVAELRLRFKVDFREV